MHRETIVVEKTVEETFDRELGGDREVGQVLISVSPNPRGGGNTVRISAPEDQIPLEFHTELLAAAEEGLASGPVMGYPVVDVGVQISGGVFTPGLSTEKGMRLACSMAVRKALEQAEPALLEPVMKVEVVSPEEFMGEVIGDLNARGGQVEGVDAKSGVNIVNAQVPLRAMFGYSTSLRSATQGRAVFSMQFSHFDKVAAKKK